MMTIGPSTEPKVPTLDARLLSALLAVALSGALMAVAAFFVWGRRLAVSVEVGGAIAASNLYVISRIGHAMVATGQSGGVGEVSAAAWGVLALGKMLLLVGGIWWLMARGLVDPLGLALGYGSLPTGIAIGSIVSDKTDTLR
jgi:hypothetical protein